MINNRRHLNGPGFDNECCHFFLEQINDFDVKEKLYVDVTPHADRVLRTFKYQHTSTGVLLAGEKGSGKTKLAKNICMDAAAKSYFCTRDQPTLEG